MDYDKMTDEQLSMEVARKRGCMIAADLVRPNGIPYCSCPGMPHGMRWPAGPGGLTTPMLHRFPRDIAIGFLKSKEPAPASKPDPEGMTVCKFIVDLRGQIQMRVTRFPQFEHYSFMVLMRGAAKEMDDHFEGECRHFSNTKDRFERDIGDMMGGADGVGAPGS